VVLLSQTDLYGFLVLTRLYTMKCPFNSIGGDKITIKKVLGDGHITAKGWRAIIQNARGLMGVLKYVFLKILIVSSRLNLRHAPLTHERRTR